MSDLTPKILELVARLARREPSQETPAPSPRSTSIPTLRLVLRRWYEMTAREADGDLPTPEEARALLSEIRRLWDDVGPAFAEAVAREAARQYYRQARRCPYCGEPGAFHQADPDGGLG